jgi:hypothetical protein
MSTATTVDVTATMVDEYKKKVAEIAISQCRCGTGADLKVKLPKDTDLPREQPKAA